MARYEPHDKFYRRAREQGLPSRAAFKIEELITRFRLVRPGARVIDLGCAPGGWLAILSQVVGESGRVVGIDLAACPRIGPNVETIVGDILNPATHSAVLEMLSGPADLVTSDLAPKLTGIKERDQARAAELIESALVIAQSTLRPGGAMVTKAVCYGLRQIRGRAHEGEPPGIGGTVSGGPELPRADGTRELICSSGESGSFAGSVRRFLARALVRQILLRASSGRTRCMASRVAASAHRASATEPH